MAPLKFETSQVHPAKLWINYYLVFPLKHFPVHKHWKLIYPLQNGCEIRQGYFGLNQLQTVLLWDALLLARNVKLHAGCSFIAAASAYLSPEPSLKMLGSRLFCDECQKAGRNQWQKSSSKDFNHTIVFVSFFRLSIILSSSCFTYMESDVLLKK